MSSDVPAQAPPAKPGEEGTNPLRLVILLSIFGLALAGLLYDYTIARPALQRADALVRGCFQGETEDPDKDGTFTDDEIQLILQRKPAEVEPLPNGKIEIYKWRSGLLFRSHTLYVVYVGRKVPLLHYVSLTRPTPEELPPVTKIEEPPTQEELDNFVPMGPSVGDDEGTGGGQQRKGRGRGKRGPEQQEDSTQGSATEQQSGAAKAGTSESESEQSDPAAAPDQQGDAQATGKTDG